MIGLALGNASDAHKPVIPFWKLSEIEKRSSLIIMSNDGSEIEGEFILFNKISEDKYKQFYESVLKEHVTDVFLPLFDSEINVILNDTSYNKILKFKGFGVECLFVSYENQLNIISIPYNKLKLLKGTNENSLYCSMIIQLLRENRLPLISTIVIQNNEKKSEIWLENIDEIQLNEKKHGTRNGFLIGLAFDVLFYLVIRSTIDIDLGQSRWGNL